MNPEKYQAPVAEMSEGETVNYRLDPNGAIVRESETLNDNQDIVNES